jgi:ribonuclease HII
VGVYGHDAAFRTSGTRVLAGVDEAGRGPIAGPVVAGAVVLPEGARIRGLRDSKLVPEGEREDLYLRIMARALHVGVGVADVQAIDRYNILGATRKAMQEAVHDLGVVPDLLLIDAVELPALPVRQVPIVKGDGKSASIAAASVVAKVVRDGLMRRYHEMYPEYGFDRHKGYCTREHIEKVRALGPCPLHRKGFEGVMTLTLPF